MKDKCLLCALLKWVMAELKCEEYPVPPPIEDKTSVKFTFRVKEK